MELSILEMNGFEIAIRDNTTDLNCLKEVLGKCYKNKTLDFNVEQGESWLDLGGNIGAFGLYCELNGAKKVTSYEPFEENFNIMEANYSHNLKHTKFEIINKAVTADENELIEFFKASKETDRYRYSVIKNARPFMTMDNLYAGKIKNQFFDGIKMDIEGSEFELIDQDLLPKCNKLVLEYHITKDKSMRNFHNRMDRLREKFRTVHYFKSLDSFDPNGNYPGFFDRMIFCIK